MSDRNRVISPHRTSPVRRWCLAKLEGDRGRRSDAPAVRGAKVVVREFDVRPLLTSPTVGVWETHCRGTCRNRSAEECTKTTQLVFPFRGVYVRHLASDRAVAEANQVLFFNAFDGYRVSHPVPGGDSSLTLRVDESQLLELAPRSLLRDGSGLAFRHQRLRIDARAQVLVALLRHSLRTGAAETLEAETLALTLAQRALRTRTTSSTSGRRRLVDRAKLLLATDLSRRWTLSEVAAEVGGSPVYLTQVFSQVEGMPLSRYQRALRLARALDLLGEYRDLTMLGLDLGFTSHSHFTAAFRQLYGRTPSAFKRSAIRSRFGPNR